MSSPKHQHDVWQYFGTVASALAAGGCLWLIASANSSTTKSLAILSAIAACTSTVLQVASKKFSPTISAANQERGAEVTPVRHYTSSWTIDDGAERGVYLGKAAIFDFGDCINIRQEEASGGTYILELKRVNQNLTGIWWFYGAHPPQGMFRGAISAEDGTIHASWQGPDGKSGGTWDLTPTDSE